MKFTKPSFTSVYLSLRPWHVFVSVLFIYLHNEIM